MQNQPYASLSNPFRINRKAFCKFFCGKDVNLQRLIIVMKQGEAKSIGKIMSEYLNPAELDDSINERRLESLWGEVVGPYINRLTLSRRVKNRVLHVVVTSAPLRNDLMINRSSLVRRLNEAAGANVIDDIVFR